MIEFECRKTKTKHTYKEAAYKTICPLLTTYYIILILYLRPKPKLSLYPITASVHSTILHQSEHEPSSHIWFQPGKIRVSKLKHCKASSTYKFGITIFLWRGSICPISLKQGNGRFVSDVLIGLTQPRELVITPSFEVEEGRSCSQRPPSKIYGLVGSDRAKRAFRGLEGGRPSSSMLRHGSFAWLIRKVKTTFLWNQCPF